MAARKRSSSLVSSSRTPPKGQEGTGRSDEAPPPPANLPPLADALQQEPRCKDEPSRQSEEHFRLLYENAPLGYQSLDADGRLLEVNPAWLKLLGYDREEVIGEWFGKFLLPESQQLFRERFSCFKAAGETHGVEFDLVRKDGSITTAWLDGLIARDEKGGFRQTHCILHDVTARKQAERARDATVELLRLCQMTADTRELVQVLTGYFQKMTGCEAVGVRLREGVDFPYYETRGFSSEFVQAENRLCAIDEAGEILRDSAGNPVLECMCGNILCGRFDASKPFFSAQGSFWTNCTTDLLASTTEADRQARTRNRCNGEGYESVALLPLRSGGETFGLVQFNDKRKGLFTAERIAQLESLVDYVAIALSQRRSEQELREAQERFRQVVESIDEVLWLTDWVTREVLYVSPSYEKVYGRSCRSLFENRRSWIEAVHPEDRNRVDRTFAEKAEHGEYTEEEYRIVRADGEIRWIRDRSFPIRDTHGRVYRWVGVASDITERKEAEEALRWSEAKHRRFVETAV